MIYVNVVEATVYPEPDLRAWEKKKREPRSNSRYEFRSDDKSCMEPTTLLSSSQGFTGKKKREKREKKEEERRKKRKMKKEGGRRDNRYLNGL